MTAAAFVRPRDLHTIVTLLKRAHTAIESEIHGRSMGATLPPGARIRISCTDRTDFQPGDVLAYLDGDKLVAHRLVRRGRGARARGYVITRGDASTACDPPVPLERAVGLVTAWRRTDAEAWRPVAPPAPRGALRRLATAANDAFIGAVLEIHPGLAREAALRTRWLRNLLGRVRSKLGRHP